MRKVLHCTKSPQQESLKSVEPIYEIPRCPQRSKERIMIYPRSTCIILPIRLSLRRQIHGPRLRQIWEPQQRDGGSDSGLELLLP